ncbi:MAG TPA: HAD-IIIA family hydrolase, partial [Tepidisphaeraceae bacterium]
MRRPAVFFDRDNTLIVGNEYLGDPAKVALVAGAPAAVAKCRELGFATVVVSNQSGVARGLFDEEAVRACNRRTDELLLAGHPAAVIDRHEYCPFHPDAVVDAYRQDSFLRKPKPGMVLQAADAMALDLARSWMVGDAPRDTAAGKAAGCRTILIIDPALPPSPAAAETGLAKADFTVASLIEAVDLIARHTHHASEPPVDPNAGPQKVTSAVVAPAA